MIVKLMESIEAEITSGLQLQTSPRWLLDSVTVFVGPYFSGEAYDHHIIDTLGSSDELSSLVDGMRFGKADLLLKSVQFRVSEAHRPFNSVSSLWQAEEPHVGLLRLLSPAYFQLPSMDIRWMDTVSGILICARERAMIGGGDRLRLRIAQDFDLLFVNQTLCGWLLTSPERYLVDSWAAASAAEPDQELIALLYESQVLVSEQNIARMEEKDPKILNELINLHDGIKCDSGSVEQRRVLRGWIKDIVERFYDREL
jgi:hypothetical protein